MRETKNSEKKKMYMFTRQQRVVAVVRQREDCAELKEH
jgi:hypothetical protein